MSNTTLPLVARRLMLTVGLALACAFATLPTVAQAAQGSGPTTDLTGFVDTAPVPQTFAQSGCLPAGGSAIPDPAIPDGDFVLVGGGWGHGAGMSQYGAQGAGRLGCTAEQILTTYFPGTAVEPVPQPAEVVLGLSSSVSSVTVVAERGPIPYRTCHYVTGECTPLPVEQGEGATWEVQVLADATYRIIDPAGPTDPATGKQIPVWEGGDYEQLLQAQLSPDPSVNRRVHLPGFGNSYRWGTLQLDSVSGSTASAYLTLKIPDMDLYLRGLAEVPASWPSTTLQAQAIAGRSYAVARIIGLGIRDACRCHLYTTPRDQNYEGWDFEAADAGIGGAWVAAVNASSGMVLRHNGTIAETFYSSSHGGQSESSQFVFGGSLPYVQPVDDSRWDLASANPLRRWTTSVSAAELGTQAGVGVATSMTLLDPLGAGGRVGSPSRGYGGVRVEGTTGTTVWSADQMKSKLGLRSTLVRMAHQPESPPPETPPTPQAPPASPAPPAPDILTRLSASGRVGTAIQVSQHGWDVAEHVVLAAADRFPDALAGVALAASLNAPLLLTETSGLNPAVADEIRRLGAETAYLLGGSSALSSAVRGDLADLGVMTRRLAGSGRAETAALIALEAVGTSADVTLAPGGDWPDAVSASSLAALVGGPPTLLTGNDRVSDATLAALRDLGARRVTLVGGTAVISDAVVTQLESLGFDVRRLSGGNRFATSSAVATEALAARPGGASLVVASGSGFADALSAGALAARTGGVLLLAPQRSLSDAPDAGTFAADHATALAGGVVVGGTGVISDTVEHELEEALDRG